MEAGNKVIADLKLIGYHYPPEEQFEFLKQIEEESGLCVKWAMWKAYTLGLMHGKRVERARGAQR